MVNCGLEDDKEEEKLVLEVSDDEIKEKLTIESEDDKIKAVSPSSTKQSIINPLKFIRNDGTYKKIYTRFRYVLICLRLE